MRCLLALSLILPGFAFAESWVAATVIRPGDIIGPAHLARSVEDVQGALPTHVEILGLEARTLLYKGRPIGPSDIGPPAVVERNAIVGLLYQRGNLRISAEGRALGRGAVGDRIRVMNLASRTTVTGTVGQDGLVHVTH